MQQHQLVLTLNTYPEQVGLEMDPVTMKNRLMLMVLRAVGQMLEDQIACGNESIEQHIAAAVTELIVEIPDNVTYQTVGRCRVVAPHKELLENAEADELAAK